MTSPYRFDTRSIHAGEGPDPSTGAHGVPIYQNTRSPFARSITSKPGEAGELHTICTPARETRQSAVSS